VTSESESWHRRDQKTGKWVLSVHVQPNARETAVAGVQGGALRIRLAAPATDGKANAALVAFLSERLGLARSLIAIRWGPRSRRKQVEFLAGADFLPELVRRLARDGGSSPEC
jgi:uncharacterized protein (TIGR00251 family)